MKACLDCLNSNIRYYVQTVFSISIAWVPHFLNLFLKLNLKKSSYIHWIVVHHCLLKYPINQIKANNRLSPLIIFSKLCDTKQQNSLRDWETFPKQTHSQCSWWFLKFAKTTWKVYRFYWKEYSCHYAEKIITSLTCTYSQNSGKLHERDSLSFCNDLAFLVNTMKSWNRLDNVNWFYSYSRKQSCSCILSAATLIPVNSMIPTHTFVKRLLSLKKYSL